MKTLISMYLIIFFTLLTSVNASSLSEKDISEILLGKIIVKKSENNKGVPGLVAAFSVSSTRENIWNTFIDYDNFPKIFEGVKRLKVIEEDQKGALVEFWIDAMLSDLNFTLYRKYDKPLHKLTWTRTAGDLQVIEGSWEILDSPDRQIKIIVYHSYVDIGQFIPAKLIRWGAMREAKDMCLTLGAWISGLD